MKNMRKVLNTISNQIEYDIQSPLFMSPNTDKRNSVSNQQQKQSNQFLNRVSQAVNDNKFSTFSNEPTIDQSQFQQLKEYQFIIQNINKVECKNCKKCLDIKEFLNHLEEEKQSILKSQDNDCFQKTQKIMNHQIYNELIDTKQNNYMKNPNLEQENNINSSLLINERKGRDNIQGKLFNLPKTNVKTLVKGVKTSYSQFYQTQTSEKQLSCKNNDLLNFNQEDLKSSFNKFQNTMSMTNLCQKSSNIIINKNQKNDRSQSRMKFSQQLVDEMQDKLNGIMNEQERHQGEFEKLLNHLKEQASGIIKERAIYEKQQYNQNSFSTISKNSKQDEESITTEIKDLIERLLKQKGLLNQNQKLKDNAFQINIKSRQDMNSQNSLSKSQSTYETKNSASDQQYNSNNYESQFSIQSINEVQPISSSKAYDNVFKTKRFSDVTYLKNHENHVPSKRITLSPTTFQNYSINHRNNQASALQTSEKNYYQEKRKSINDSHQKHNKCVQKVKPYNSNTSQIKSLFPSRANKNENSSLIGSSQQSKPNYTSFGIYKKVQSKLHNNLQI